MEASVADAPQPHALRSISEMPKFTNVERGILDWMAERLPIPNLKEQIAVVVTTGREYTGVGAITSLSVPEPVPAIKCSSPILGPVIEADGIEHGGTSNLFLDQSGKIVELELIASGDRFTEDSSSFKLTEWEGIEPGHGSLSRDGTASEHV